MPSLHTPLVSSTHIDMAAEAALVARRCQETTQTTELGKSDGRCYLLQIILSATRINSVIAIYRGCQLCAS